jgi:hypothetical protein
MGKLLRLAHTITAAIGTMCLAASAAHAQVPALPDPTRKPNPASEATVSRMSEEALQWHPNYELMTDEFAANVRAQETALRQMFQQLGQTKSIVFVGVTPTGMDVYNVQYANGVLRWAIQLTPEGKTATALLVRLKDETTGPPSITARAVLPAIEGVFQAFKTHNLVGLGDDHGLMVSDQGTRLAKPQRLLSRPV